MKKFTLLMVAALIAVLSWAGVPVREQKQMPLQTTMLTKASARQVTPTKQAVRVQAPADNRFAAKAKAKAKAKKAPKKAGIADLLAADWMLCSLQLDYDEEAGGLVDASIPASGRPVTFTLGEDMQSLSIEGFTSDATEPIQASFAMVTDVEMLAEGIIAVATIPDGQTLLDSDYGPILLQNCTNPGEPLTAEVMQDGFVVINEIWAAVIGGTGTYAGYIWSDYYYSSIVVPANGKMSWGEGDDAEEHLVYIDQDPETLKNVTVYNFGGEESAVTLKMKANNTFVIESQLVYEGGSTYGDFYTYATDGTSVSPIITGVGTEKELVFTTDWTFYAPTTGYWYGQNAPATIAYTNGSTFMYPEPVADVAATPAEPVDLTIGDYDASKGYGYFAFTIPTVDIDDNELDEEKLYYQLYSDIDGVIEPIIFTPEICDMLTEDMSIIPYTFTDDWDFQDKGTYKVVFLNYNFNAMYDFIGVKSIYTGGGETNESDIIWAEIEKAEAGGEVVFDFNEMDLPTSSNNSTDGDITETTEITEGVVTLAISPKAEGATTTNRFWATGNGPQLRVYSGTLTFTAAEGAQMSSIVFNYGKWGEGNTADSGELVYESGTATWTNEEPQQEVVFTIAANTQINSIVVTLAGGEDAEDALVELPEGVEPEEFTLTASGAEGYYDLSVEDTRLVAFDGNTVYVQGLAAAYFPESYVKGQLTEDNKVVFKSGQLVGEDSYGPEYLVGFSAGDEDYAVFESEFVFDFDPETRTMTLADGYYVGESAEKDDASLYAYLSTAVYTEGALVLPPLVELPEGVEPEAWALEGFYSDGSDGNDVFRAAEVAFDGEDVYVKGLAYWFEDAWLKGTLDAESGIVTFPTGQFVGRDEYGKEFMVGFDEDFCDIQYEYDADAKKMTQLTPYIMECETETGLDAEGDFAFWGFWMVSNLHEGEPMAVEAVEAPEGLQTESYLFTAMEFVEDEDDYEYEEARMLNRKKTEDNDDSIEVEFNFNELDVPTSSSDSSDGDITEPFVISDEGFVLTVSPRDERYTNAENRFWATNAGPQLRVYSGTITLEVPEGCSMNKIVFNHNGKWGATNSADSGELTNDADAKAATWTGDAQTVVFTIGEYDEAAEKYTSGNSQINSIELTVVGEGDDDDDDDDITLQPYSYQLEIGFDGNDVYFKGLSEDTSDMWIKGTLSEDKKTVTIPASQYMGYVSSWSSSYDFYITASEDGETFDDIVLNYDAETNTFSTDQTILLNGSMFVYYPYQAFTAVEITKMVEFAATPADPEITDYKLEGTSYPYICINVPAEDVDGNAIVASKLFYTVWIEKGGEQLPFTVVADEYKYVEEDMTEIPYNYDDSWDIYKGGAKFYFNPVDGVATWTKIGVQSIYYGEGERNTSDIIWMQNPVYAGTEGIHDFVVDANKLVIFDLQGRRLENPAKGLYIINGKKVVIK